MRKGFLLAASGLLMAASASSMPPPLPAPLQLVSDGYTCFKVFCEQAPTVAECIICCFAFCSQSPTMESDCQKACGGWVPPTEVTNGLVLEAALRARRLDRATPQEHAESVGLIAALAVSDDERTSWPTRALGAELPLESDRRLVKPLHNEQGDAARHDVPGVAR